MLPIARPNVPPTHSRAELKIGSVGPELAIANASRIEEFAARLLCRYLRSTADRSCVVWCDAEGHIQDARAADEFIGRILANAQPLIATYWITDALAVALMPLVDGGFADLFSSVTCVVDDTFAGRVAGGYIERISGQYALLALPGDPERLRQVLALMKRRISCAFPVDGGGPYRQVGTGIISLSMALRASIVPIVAMTRPALPAIHPSKVRLPAPATTVFAAIGHPLPPVYDEDRHAQATRLRSALDRLRVGVCLTADDYRR
jgi:lysophospholipid acyltransferase (LPLAT)-like uncharacterized protein